MLSISQKTRIGAGFLGAAALTTGWFTLRQPVQADFVQTAKLQSSQGEPLSSIFQGIQAAGMTADEAIRLHDEVARLREERAGSCASHAKPGFIADVLAWVRVPIVHASSCQSSCSGNSYNVVDAQECGTCWVGMYTGGGPNENGIEGTSYDCGNGTWCCGWDTCTIIT